MAGHPLLSLTARQLKAVTALAENRNFIAAATDLKISQPALTRVIKQVESLLGVELFSRTTRQVSVTAAGKEFVALAERVLCDLKIGVESMRSRHGETRGQVTVASVLLCADPSFARMVMAFRRLFPGVDLQLREGMQGQVLDDVRSGVADIGVAYVNALPDSFAVEALGVEHMHAVLPTHHPLARKRKIDIRELKDYPLISYPLDAHTRRVVDAMAVSAGVALRSGIAVNRAATMMNLVRAGAGVGVAPSSDRPSNGERGVTSRPLASAMVSRLGLVRLHTRELNPPLVTLQALLREWVRDVAPRRLRAARSQKR